MGGPRGSARGLAMFSNLFSLAAPEASFSHLIVGLGNPGPRYAQTRHNIGFMVLDALALDLGASPWEKGFHSLVARARLAGRDAMLVKPQTYMNRSGLAVKSLLETFNVDLALAMVVHDDIDMSLGAMKIRPGGGHGGHNGIRSIVESLGCGNFSRLKIGIGRPIGNESVSDYVLSIFPEDEIPGINKILDLAVCAVATFADLGAATAMNKYNSSNVFQKE